MLQLLKETFRSNLWAMMGKLDQTIPSDYQFPITPLLYSNMPALAFLIDTKNLPLRGNVVLKDILDRGRLGGNTIYMRNQGWNLVIKMIENGHGNLARWLDLELEALDVY